LRTVRGEAMVLKNNVFIENVLPGWILRTLDDEEMAEYRRSYLEPGKSRLPTLTWPRQIPRKANPQTSRGSSRSTHSGWGQRLGFPSSS